MDLDGRDGRNEDHAGFTIHLDLLVGVSEALQTLALPESAHI
jgi:hypothetical protein